MVFENLQSLDSGDEYPKSVGTSKNNVKLNRFANITVCECLYAQPTYNTTHISDDHNRVILSPLEDYTNCQGDFVNACYIDVRHYNYNINAGTPF